MAKIGYARVSSAGQSLEVQLEKLKGCEKIYREAHSAKTDIRPQLQICLDFVRDGDTLVITKLDRLARSPRDLLTIWNKLNNKNVRLQVLDQNIDSSTSAGKLMLALLGEIAEFESGLRKEWKAYGVELAKKKGIQIGRMPKLNAEKIQEMKALRDSGIRIKDLMAKYGLSRSSIYRML